MKLGIIRLYSGESGKLGYYNIQELGLAKALAKKGVNTDIFFLVGSKQSKDIIINEISDQIRIIHIPSKKIFNHGIISPKFILEYRIDVVHLLSDNQLMVPSFIKFCKKNKIPVYNYIGTITSDTNKKIKKIIMGILAKRNIKYFKNSKVIVKTKTVEKQLLDKGVNNVNIIPVGLDLNIIPQINSTKNEIRNELGISIEKRVLIFVGRLEEYKKPAKAVELINELKKMNNDYLLIIIGDGSLKDRILNLIREYRLESNVTYIDKIENYKIHKYYKASDIFVNFNDNEIFGMSVLEAMYQKCNVIAINAPGPNYIINNGVDGIIVNNFKIDKWIEAIEENFDNHVMAEAAKNKIINYFNWDNISDEYIQLFNSLEGE